MTEFIPTTSPSTPEEHRAYWETRYPTIPYGYCCCGCGEVTKAATMTSSRRQKVQDCPQFYAAGGHQNRLPYDRWRAEDRGFDTPCHIWQGGVDKQGYGYIYNRSVKAQRAHRFFYELQYGELPGYKNLHHVCRVRNCVNPDHVEPLTPTEHRSVHAKLGGGKADDIRYLHSTKRYTLSQLAGMYDVVPGSITAILYGRSHQG